MYDGQIAAASHMLTFSSHGGEEVFLCPHVDLTDDCTHG
jgi:hypothetical protein